MKLTLVTILPALLIGYVSGGRLRNLSAARVRWWPAAIAGVLLQVAPALGTVALWLLLGSFVLLLAFVLANIRLAGFALILVGLALNFAVIGANQGMPVSRHALVASGQAETLAELVEEGGAKHHLAGEDDTLLFLGDVIPLGTPVNRAISVGDIGTHAGVMWFIIVGMRRRTPRGGGRKRHRTARHRGTWPMSEASESAAGPGTIWRPLGAVFQLAVVLPLLVWLAIDVPRNVEAIAEGPFWLWLVAVIVVEVIPVPAWGGLQLSLGFPILLAVAIIYPPSIAALIALIGSVDPREFKREVSLLKAVFNRSQMAASILAGSAIFHAVASIDSPVVRLIPALLLAAVVAYGLNALFIATLTGIDRRLPVIRVLVKMHGTAPYEFLATYVGLGLFGAVIARFYEIEGFWSVIVFLAPLVFARQMYFRSRALADRLAEQNELLAKQAERLETLLEKEHENVAALRELNRMKEEFVAVVSHELRTPVTALIGYAKTLRQPQFAEDPGMREEFLERMERQGDRLLRLVENLLTASNVENKELPMSVGRVRFDDLCREIVEGLASDSDRVRLELAHDVPAMQTDRQLLGRVISNLVDNALKYSPEGTPCELGARREGEDEIVFWVRDHGVGMAPEELQRIFDRFYQVDSSITRTFRGAGLGLSLVKNLLDHLGGRIDVQSAAGAGSTFTVTLPVTFPGLVPGEADGGSRPNAVTPLETEGEGSETLSAF